MPKCGVRVNGETKPLEIARIKRPMAYREAADLAMRSAEVDIRDFG